MDISNLPKEKNITEFTDKELFLWLKNYIGTWVSAESAAKHYEAVKAELARRSGEKLHKLTVAIVWLTGGLIILTVALFLKK